MHLKPKSGCHLSTLIFEFGGTLYISHEKIPKDGKVLYQSGLKTKVFPGPLADLSA
jgi:hypothetical protein